MRKQRCKAIKAAFARAHNGRRPEKAPEGGLFALGEVSEWRQAKKAYLRSRRSAGGSR